MCATCVSTVLGERCSCSAMRRFVWPASIRPAISRSRSVSALDAALGPRRATALTRDAAPSRRSSSAAWSCRRRACSCSSAAVSATVASRRATRDGERLPGQQVRAGRVERVAGLVGVARGGARGLGGAGRLPLREQDRRAGALGLPGTGGKPEPRPRARCARQRRRPRRPARCAAARGRPDGAMTPRSPVGAASLGASEDLVPLRLERALDQREIGAAGGADAGRRGRPRPPPGALPRGSSRRGRTSGCRRAPAATSTASRADARARARGRRPGVAIQVRSVSAHASDWSLPESCAASIASSASSAAGAEMALPAWAIARPIVIGTSR